MGMYTEIHFDATLRPLPPEIESGLKRLMVGEPFEAHEQLPKHALFASDRAWVLMCCGSAYFDDPNIAPTLTNAEYGTRLEFRSNIKNYCGSIGKFLDWILPYVSKGNLDQGAFAKVRYEESDSATWFSADASELELKRKILWFS